MNRSTAIILYSHRYGTPQQPGILQAYWEYLLPACAPARLPAPHATCLECAGRDVRGLPLSPAPSPTLPSSTVRAAYDRGIIPLPLTCRNRPPTTG